MQAARLNIFALFIEPWRFFNPFGIEESGGGPGVSLALNPRLQALILSGSIVEPSSRRFVLAKGQPQLDLARTVTIPGDTKRATVSHPVEGVVACHGFVYGFQPKEPCGGVGPRALP